MPKGGSVEKMVILSHKNTYQPRSHFTYITHSTALHYTCVYMTVRALSTDQANTYMATGNTQRNMQAMKEATILRIIIITFIHASMNASTQGNKYRIHSTTVPLTSVQFSSVPLTSARSIRLFIDTRVK